MKRTLTLAVAVLFSAAKAGYAGDALNELKSAAPAGDTKVLVSPIPAPVPLSAAAGLKGPRGIAPAAGNYLGTTALGGYCGVKIEKQYDTVYLQISWVDRSGKYQSCGFFPKKTSGSGNFLEMSGGSEFSVCRTGLTLDQAGVPAEAKFAIGSFLQFGYDETCSGLRSN